MCRFFSWLSNVHILISYSAFRVVFGMTTELSSCIFAMLFMFLVSNAISLLCSYSRKLQCDSATQVKAAILSSILDEVLLPSCVYASLSACFLMVFLNSAANISNNRLF
jgi:hypothetical protein